MFCFVAPEQGQAEHERLLAIEESILQELEIPYRVVAIAVDDLGASAAMKYDCEAWLPGPGALPRADLVLEHDRLPGPAARHPLPAGRRPAGARSTRSTAPRSRSGGRSSRCSRTASRRTDRCGCPSALVRYGAPDGACRRRALSVSRRARRRRGALVLEHDQRRARRPARRDLARASGRRTCSRAARTRADGSSPPPAALDDRARRTTWRRGLGVGGHEQLGDRTVDRLVLGERRAAPRRRRDIAWTSRRCRSTRKASRGLGAVSARVSSSRPSPQEAQTRAVGGGGELLGDGAAQCPQNHAHSTRRVRRRPRGRASKPDVMLAIASLPLDERSLGRSENVISKM